jgi:hypothetical protein
MAGVTFSVTSNIREVVSDVNARFVSQVPFATARALTQVAQIVQREVTASLPSIFDRPTPFTMRAVQIIPATKTSMTSTVYILPQQAQYLGLEIAGGVRLPANVAIPVPVDIPLNRYGSMSPNIVAQLLRRADCFSGTVHGHPGIFQRVAGGKVIMLIGWAKRTQYESHFDFAGIAQRVIGQSIKTIFEQSLQDAIATAR